MGSPATTTNHKSVFGYSVFVVKALTTLITSPVCTPLVNRTVFVNDFILVDRLVTILSVMVNSLVLSLPVVLVSRLARLSRLTRCRCRLIRLVYSTAVSRF